MLKLAVLSGPLLQRLHDKMRFNKVPVNFKVDCGRDNGDFFHSVWDEFTVLSEGNSLVSLQGNITGLTGTMDFKDGGSNSHVQFEILGSSFSETFGKDIKRVSSHSFSTWTGNNRRWGDIARCVTPEQLQRGGTDMLLSNSRNFLLVPWPHLFNNFSFRFTLRFNEAKYDQQIRCDVWL